MARQNINRGTVANDGNGDTLRAAAKKINDNFREIYLTIGGDSSVITSAISFVDSGLSFEGATNDAFETILGVVNPTADRKVIIPNYSGNIVLDSDTGTLKNKTLTSPVLTTPQINDTSANHQYIVAPSELAADRTITLPLLTGNDEVTFNSHTQTLINKTLTSPLLTNQKVGGKNLGGFVQDSASNELLEFDRVASAVNHVKISNTATGNFPKIEATGGDTNVSLNLASKGNGGVDINTKLIYNIDTVSTSTAVDLRKPLTIFTPGSGTIIPTLASGDRDGEVHFFIAKGAGNVNLTGSNNIQGADSAGSFFQMETGASLQLLWNGSKWNVLSSVQNYDSSNTSPIRLV